MFYLRSGRGFAYVSWLTFLCRWMPVASSCLLAVLSGCAAARPVPSLTDVLSPVELGKIAAPSNQRQWEPAMAVLPYAEFNGNQVTVRNIRNCEYLSEQKYVVRHYDKTFDLNQLQTVDFVVVPFKGAPALAHTMLSFGFGEQGYVGVSVEVRLEEGESYSPVKGAMRQYELMYVVADERDVIGLRTKHRKADVYLYPTRATPPQVRALFWDVMVRVNKLAIEPEFYDTFTNNCTTNIVNHINRIYPGRVPVDVRALLPGYADQLAYDLGLLANQESFPAARRRAHINRLANQHADAADFSRKIRL